VKVSIIIPVLNQLEYTKMCLESIYNNSTPGTYEIIVVDNGSTDGTAAWLKGKKNIIVIKNRKNIGVAAAWNQGIKKSRYDYVCIINNDLILSAGWLDALTNFYMTKKDAGVVSPGTREGILDYNFEKYAASYIMAMKNHYEREIFGWCMLIKKDRFEKAGLFDEVFKVGVGEDRDFYRRLKEHGFTSYITGSAFVHHFRSATLKAVRKKIGKKFEDDNVLLLNKRWGEGKDGYVKRKTASFFKLMKRIYMYSRHGHLLLEK
jgi:GT2 family glycosyltransferase